MAGAKDRNAVLHCGHPVNDRQPGHIQSAIVHSAEIQGKRFSVLGGARSGLAVAALLQGHGGAVFVSDRAPAATLPQAGRELEALGIPFEFGENSARVLQADVLVLSPGVPSDAPVVREARSKGIPVLSEIEVAGWFCPARIAAITGTNGKTTTTSLLGRIFEDAGVPAVVGGNIGTAFSQIVPHLTAGMTAILEVSSFQLDHIQTFRPRVAVLLNITPDHLDRYENRFDRYIASKCRVFENQQAGDTLVYNADDEITRQNVEARFPAGITLLPFSQQRILPKGAFLERGRLMVSIDGSPADLMDPAEISIRGAHNLYNAMAAILAAKALGIPAASLRGTLKSFKGVEHRLEFVRVLDGVTYVNDSKATNVDSVWYALQSFTMPIVLLLGGRDKGNDYTRLMDPVRKHVRAIVAIGESAAKVHQAFAATTPVTMCGTMDDAVHAARGAARPGDIVLLSPACASFDWFENYEHRGRVFKERIHALTPAP
jgi:UDP-N-acetylmuramoylalanine--D-glutamate ligase